MGYRAKVKAQEAARALRAQNRTIANIAKTLGVSKSSVSLWVRDVPVTPSPRRYGPHRRPHPAHEAKLRQIEELNRQGSFRIGKLRDKAFLVAGVALYAGEGSKTDGEVRFSNSDPNMVRLFCAWLRHFFDVDESRLRGRLYLHEGAGSLSEQSILVEPHRHSAQAVSQGVSGSSGSKHPSEQARAWLLFGRLWVRANAPRSNGTRKGFAIVGGPSGVAQQVEQGIVNPKAAGSSPAPGAHTPPRSRTTLPSDEKSFRP
jgi:hypothetical protein